ncbi:hypothetical protein FB563_3159 [Streptomyces puniciscabiei]|uniref:Pentapeptide repeat protein n=1 Tax=Streptomyces puniciscabiei TaxID=164348 RepID=A0A542UGE4_9ACTN|nr:hypothetical protein [Streptomyces puniciscabiei]TQK98145.1 hypothetical protein FB563_3159 [Streptomyces puniciscabiei]
MRAPAVLAAIALAGTVLLGGAAQALADDNDDMGMGSVMGNAGGDFGSTSLAKPDSGKDASGLGQGQGASGFGKAGSIFDRTTG